MSINDIITLLAALAFAFVLAGVALERDRWVVIGLMLLAWDVLLLFSWPYLAAW